MILMVSHHYAPIEDRVNCQGLTPPKGDTSGGAEMPPFRDARHLDASVVGWIAHFLAS